MPTVYLLRHCEYDNPRNILPGRLPVELSVRGLQQAEKLRYIFADKNISHIYSSAVKRCLQTAQSIADGKIPITFDQRILETLSAYQGYWDENRHDNGYHFFSHKSELGGESLTDLRQRMASFWDELVPRLQPDENIIICSHGDPLQVLYGYIHDLPLVTEGAEEAEIPGWLEKGKFHQIVLG